MKRLQFRLRTLMIVSTAACLYIACYFWLLSPSTESITVSSGNSVSVRYWYEPNYKFFNSVCGKIFAPIELLDRQVRSDFWKGDTSQYRRMLPDEKRS
jgi:hypothetical protein